MCPSFVSAFSTTCLLPELKRHLRYQCAASLAFSKRHASDTQGPRSNISPGIGGRSPPAMPRAQKRSGTSSLLAPSSGANVSSTSCARSSMSRTILSRWRRFKLVTCCCSSWSLAPGAETSVRAPWIVSGNSEDADRQWNAPVICDLARGGSSITQTSNVAPPSQIGLGCHGS